MKNNYGIKIYSIGASNELHGPALPTNIDDFFAKRVAVIVSEKIGADYVGHLPYSSDRIGSIAKDWNKSYIGIKELINNVITDISKDISRQRKSKLEVFSHVIIISGHGGNNLVKDSEEFISKKINVPTLYIPPLSGVYALHSKYGRIIPSHADDAEHSIGLYMGLLDKEEFNKINKSAKTNPMEVLKKWPQLMGLGGYVLPELGGKRYKKLRSMGSKNEKKARKFLQTRSIIADKGIGRQLVEGNIEMALNLIKNFADIK